MFLRIYITNSLSISPQHICLYWAQIWHKSDDENLEILIDESIRKIEKMSFWSQSKFINMLYEDGTKLQNNEDNQDKTYYDFVTKIYEEAGGNKFFDDFIDNQYSREIKIWRHKMESQKELKAPQEIFKVLQGLDFKQFDFDKNSEIDFDEFKK